MFVKWLKKKTKIKKQPTKIRRHSLSKKKKKLKSWLDNQIIYIFNLMDENGIFFHIILQKG